MLGCAGIFSYANAGHNPPAMRSKDGEYAFGKSHPNLILAGMDGVQSRKYEL